MQAKIAALAKEKPTAVSLRDLFIFGKLSQRSPSVRLQNAVFLHRELPIRMAQRIEELRSLPFDLDRSPPIVKVMDWYERYVSELTSIPRITTSHEERLFTDLIAKQLERPSLVVTMLSAAVAGPQHSATQQQLSFMQSVLDRFFTARIGLRFLMEHHVASAEKQDEQWSGVIRANFDPTEVIRDAADDAGQLCLDEMGSSPEVIVEMEEREHAPSEKRNSRLTGVPSHLHYICTELLKNAMRATATRHEGAACLPPVRVRASFGEEQLSLRISDEGGGIPLPQVHRMWRYGHTTAPTPLLDLEEDDSAAPPQGMRRAALAGYGMGLPLSRLYAQYLGGRLDVRSLEGCCTDCYVYIPRLGSACERLPPQVQLSPAERESTDQSTPLFDLRRGGVSGEPLADSRPKPQDRGFVLSELTELEFAVLSERLADLRHSGDSAVGERSRTPSGGRGPS